jgi:hypothetical protein
MKELRYREDVTFKIGNEKLHYVVRETFLGHAGGYNGRIFIELGLSQDEKMALASKHYNYITEEGDWPSFKQGDYAAATELVKALYDLCNIHNIKLL